eukprot:31317-Pelagomonas_calceolata.AAC.2
MHTGSLLSILQNTFISIVHILNVFQKGSGHAGVLQALPECLPWNGVLCLLKVDECRVQAAGLALCKHAQNRIRCLQSKQQIEGVWHDSVCGRESLTSRKSYRGRGNSPYNCDIN